MRIRFSADAREDIQGIADYTYETWGEEQETVYLDELYAVLEEISTDPDRWRMRDDLFEGCQVAPCGKHMVFFRVVDDVVLVSRILHQAMDVPNHTFPIKEE